MEKPLSTQPAPAAKVKNAHKHSHQNAFYGLGFIGAAIYYISTATSFWIGVLGFLKAIIWPVFLVYEWMKYLGM